MKSEWKLRIFIMIAIIEFLMILAIYSQITPQNPVSSKKKFPAVLVINIDGEIITSNFFGIYEERDQNRTNGTSSMNIIRMLEYFSEDDSIKAFILEIDSYGGQTAGKEEIARYIKRMDKPVITVITNKALSSGYFVAASTDKIYAKKSSQIGEITKTFVYVDRTRKGQKQVCTITSSTYKTISLADCNGFDPIIFEKLRAQVAGSHELLVSHIAEMRGLSESSIENISNVKIMNSEEALKSGLIDEVGTTNDAVAWLEDELNTHLKILYLRDMLPGKK
ncbi:S49 family peptidase [Candidatus Woesearchaeota archaeon]|nr:MAG: protease IV [archaeon GW2011_AR4]MBS3129541.1 S49 family peptidase [Candidatus Woesearchaeota archaeon]HIH37509.1 hypothetical protein [Candidatus Woesearchaeota archaeon]HIH49742.1 hypothetical protein [Candidatus Woesearchaeota archaeon]HIJ03236.1 hypothetical protein [Candidatus Woesearchaeota archaeon]